MKELTHARKEGLQAGRRDGVETKGKQATVIFLGGDKTSVTGGLFGFFIRTLINVAVDVSNSTCCVSGRKVCIMSHLSWEGLNRSWRERGQARDWTASRNYLHHFHALSW